MKTSKQLKETIENLFDQRRENGDKLQNQMISAEEFIKNHDSINHKVAGWRNSLMFYLASICNEDVRDIRKAHVRLDEVDLYLKYFSH